MANIYTEYTVPLPAYPTIVDLGCCQGFESYKMWQVFHPCKIIAVDPFPENTNYTLNVLKDFEDCHADCCAVDEQNGETIMFYHCTSHTNNQPCGDLSSLFSKDEGAQERAVVTKTLKSICPSPTILKIDIEGAEWICYNQFFEDSVALVFMELHTPVKGHTLDELLAFAKEKGFSFKFYEYAQSQTKDFDDCRKINKESITFPCHILFERKVT